MKENKREPVWQADTHTHSVHTQYMINRKNKTNEQESTEIFPVVFPLIVVYALSEADKGGK